MQSDLILNVRTTSAGRWTPKDLRSAFDSCSALTSTPFEESRESHLQSAPNRMANAGDILSVVNDLPAEILGAIFDMVVLPSYFCNMASAGQPLSTWKMAMRQKLHLVGVSRAWYLEARSYLYEEIAITDVGQVIRLSDSLNRNQNLGPLVRSLVLACYIGPVDNDRTKELEIRLLGLFSKLPNLTSFNYVPSRQLLRRAGSDGLGRSQLPTRLSNACAATITQLWLSSPITWEQVAQILGLLSHRLVSFRLPATHNAGEGENISFGPNSIDTPFSFRVLETLFVDIDRRSPFTRALVRWDMPALKRLTVSGGRRQDIRIDSLRSLSAIIRNWPTIQYLNINDGSRTRQKAPVIADIIYQLPNLEHLVTQACYLSSFQKPHPRLRWIDVYLDSTSASLTASLEASLDRKNFTRFQAIRSISPQLIDLLLLPFTLHPSSPPGKGCTRSFSAGDVCFEYTSDGIRAKPTRSSNGYRIREEESVRVDDDLEALW